MRRLAGLAGAVVLAAAVGGCSSSSSSTSASPMSGTETLTGTLAGEAAVTWLNRYGSASPSFASLVFTGPVDTTLTGPLTVGRGNAHPATQTFVTPAGNLTVQYTAKTYGGGQPTATGRSGTTCHFRLDGGTGTYVVLGSQSTGKFAGATGHGTYAFTILTAANMLADKTFCDLLSGSLSAKSTSITFKASGPLTLKR